MTHLDLQKHFPIYHVCPKCLAALLCDSPIRKNASTFLQVLDEVGMTLVDWKRGNFHCELIQHPENPKNRSYNYFILQFLYPAREFQNSVLILVEFSSRNSIEGRTLKFP